MGVTIHFAGRIRDAEALEVLLEAIWKSAQVHGWPAWRIDNESVTLKRVIDEEDVDYVGPTRGIGMEPHPDAEPLIFEFDQDMFMQDYCKTQFAGLVAHVQIIEFLRRIAPQFTELSVEDEGEYWETGDREVLAQHLTTIDSIIAEEVRNNPAYQVAYRLPSGRIVDLIS
jgi:hypothetical protein